MAQLLKENPTSQLATRIGGMPNVPSGFEWPICKACNGPMQFLAQVGLAETDIENLAERQQLLLLFQCQNEPGMCDEWDPDGGGNSAVLVPQGGTEAPTPPAGPTTLPSVSPVSATVYDDTNLSETPDDNYCSAFEADTSVLGKTGGAPLWIQGDETPTCPCGSRMTFVSQIEERGGGGINFGDAGAGYAFVCVDCESSAKFLWQCG